MTTEGEQQGDYTPIDGDECPCGASFRDGSWWSRPSRDHWPHYAKRTGRDPDAPLGPTTTVEVLR